MVRFEPQTRMVLELQTSEEIDLFKTLHCFGTNEVTFRFQEELMVRFEPQKRDLQF